MGILQNSLNMNVLTLMIESFTFNKKIYEYIDEYYEEHKHEAFKLAINNEFYNHNIFCNGSIIKEVMCKKLLGLFLIDDDSFYIDLIKTGWDDLYKYMIRNKEIDFSDVELRFIVDKHITDNYINSIYIIILISEEIFNYYVKRNDDYEEIKNLLKFQTDYFDPSKSTHTHRLDLKNLDSGLKEKSIKLKKEIFGNEITNTSELYAFIRNNNKDLKYDFIFDSEDLMADSILDSEQITNNDLISLIYIYLICLENKALNKQDLIDYMVPALYLKLSLRAYKSLKEYYFKNNKESTFIDFDIIEKENEHFKTKIIDLNRQIAFLEKENWKLKREYKNSLEKDLSNKQKEIEKLKKKIKHLESDNEKLTQQLNS